VIDRFRLGGHRIILEALRKQTIICGDDDVAGELASVVELVECPAGKILIRQGHTDNDMYLVFAGMFSIVVNGRPVARRVAEQHVGEMALLDPGARRAASVVAVDDAVVARVSEPVFSDIANRYPEVWRRIACQLAVRLRQRNELVRERNAVPRVFVGSSTECLDLAEAVRDRIAGATTDVRVWTDGIFGPSDYSLEAL
jgi:CRP/FNR family transcriptional regulator, cyclic AMP receptor protein